MKLRKVIRAGHAANTEDKKNALRILIRRS
jgi:hypothetical protein